MAIKYLNSNIIKMYYGGNEIKQAYLNGEHFLPIGETPKIYGFAVDETVSDPYNAVTYIEDSANFTPATMTDGVFDGGSWLDVYPFNQVKPCRFNSGGTVSYYVDPNNYALQEDGVTSAENTIRIMIEIPSVYWKFTTTETGYEVRFSDTQIDSSYQALAHSRGDVLKGNLYVGAYEGYNDSGVLRSGSGKTPTVNQTISTLRTASNYDNDGFGLMNFHTWTLLQILFISMFKSLDSQSALGNGVSGADTPINTGSLDTVGMYYGTTADQTTGVKFMGIENLWGNTETFIDGMCTRIDTGTGYENELRISDNSTFSDNGENYAYIIDGSEMTSASNAGYITKVLGSQIGAFLPSTGGGSETTYYCDLLSDDYSDSSNDVNIYRVGGAFNRGSIVGIFCISDCLIEHTPEGTGARLQYLAP